MPLQAHNPIPERHDETLQSRNETLHPHNETRQPRKESIEPRDETLEPGDQMREESPTVNRSPDDERSDDIDVEPVTMAHAEPIVSQYLAKSSGRHTEKNMFYPNKTTPINLYGKSNSAITNIVNERIRQNPSLQAKRVNIVNEERSKQWNRLTEEEQKVWVDKAKEQNEQPPDFGTVRCVCPLLVTSSLTPSTGRSTNS
jgi:hypothetical protein